MNTNRSPIVSGTMLPCPYCGNDKHLVGPIYVVREDPLNDVYLCDHCGVVFKPIYNENPEKSTKSVYSQSSWNLGLDEHRQRFADVVKKALQFVDLGEEDSVLDIGPGIGMFLDELQNHKSLFQYIAVEPSIDVALALKSRHPLVSVLLNDINAIPLPPRRFKLIAVLGVDYLFKDIRGAFAKIASAVEPNGVVLIQRNAFIDIEGYHGKTRRVYDLPSLFDPNPLIRNWFHPEQYLDFLKMFFEIKDVEVLGQKFVDNSGEFEVKHVTVVASPLVGSAPPPKIKSYRDQSISILQNLSGPTSQ